jgi:transcriptional regulator NrdR family protein
MNCPKCDSRLNRVVESVDRLRWRWRRRKCLQCGQRFSTRELWVGNLRRFNERFQLAVGVPYQCVKRMSARDLLE